MSFCPQYFICPITHNIMNEPYIDNEGNSYEEVAIKKWLVNNNTSPITRNILNVFDLKLNKSLKDAIQAYKLGNVTNDNVDNVTTIKEYPICLKEYSETNKYNKIVSLIIEPQDITEEVFNDIVIIIDISGSMDSVAYVNQDGKQNDVGFTILDITKHSIKTIIEAANSNDRISIVTFSDSADVVSCLIEMTPSNKKYLKSLVGNLKVKGCTNIWAGLNLGLKQFDVSNRNKTILFMTDGVPSYHLLPPRGIIESLKKNIEKFEIKPTIYTFGFGYSLDTELLADIANIGNGTFSFIPDSGFVGTIMIHAIANIKSICATNAIININTENGTTIKKIYGGDTKINNVNYGETRELIVVLETNNNDYNYNINLEYTFNNNKKIVKSTEINNYNNINNIIRFEYIDLLNTIIKKMPDVDFLNKYIEDFTYKYNSSKEYITDLKEQVILAISSTNIYDKWGKNYIYSLMYAHKNKLCNNFKDKSIANYGGTLFKTLVEKIDDIYSNMEPPIPSNANSTKDITVRKGVPKNFDFKQSFNNASGGCFHEDSKILVYPNIYKKCSEIIKDDIVVTEKGYSKVLCVIKIKCNDNKCDMVKINDGLQITPYHPIKNNVWVFPNSIKNSEYVDSNYMYNFILEKDHIINISNILCATLGHNINDNNIIKHDYYGTDAVLNDLKKCKGYNEGLITFADNCVIRDNNNNVISFDLEKIC